MRVITKPSSQTLCELEVTTEKAKEKQLLELGEEVFKFLNPEDMKVIISSRGKVLVKENKGFYRLVKSFKSLDGYDCVNIQDGTYLVHSLVAKVFLSDPPSLLSQIQHINGDKSDNSVSNLRWYSPEEEWRNIRAVKPHTGESALFSNLHIAIPFIRGLNGTQEGVIKAMEERKRYRGYFWVGDRTLLP